jgi:chromate transporter
MARSLCPDRERATIAIVAAVAVLAFPTAIGQLLTIAVAGAIGWKLLPAATAPASTSVRVPVGRRAGVVALALFFGFLIALPIARQLYPG